MKYAHIFVPKANYVFVFNTNPSQVDWLVSNLQSKYNKSEIEVTFSNIELTKEEVLQFA